MIYFICDNMNTIKPLDKTYSFDLDGNIAHLNTPVLFEEKQADWSRKLIEISVKDYDHNPKYADREQYRPLDNNREKTFMHARDSYKNAKHRWVEWLKIDMLEAINKQQFGPSFYRLLFDVWLQWRSFSINTARGHTPDNIKNSIQDSLMTLLSPKWLSIMAQNIRNRYQLVNNDSDTTVIWWYLDRCTMYYGWANIELRKHHMISHITNSSLIKTIYQDKYIHWFHDFSKEILKSEIDYPVKMWFSDDGYDNTKYMLECFLSMREKKTLPYDNMKFRVYYTGEHIDVVQKNIEEEIIKILGSIDGVIVEKKQHSLADYYKELQVNGESIFQDDKHNYDDKIYESLKIML